jgi:hypothetical protein
MNSRRVELLVDLLWLGFAGSYCAIAAGYPPEGRLVPLTFGIITLVVGLLHFFGNFVAVLRPFTHTDSMQEPPAPIARSELIAVLWAAALLAGIFLIGALPAIFLFLLLYFGLRGRRWVLGLASAIVMTAITWGLFGQLITLNLPVGILTRFVLKLF